MWHALPLLGIEKESQRLWEESGIPSPYDKQGEYHPESGRFTAEDVVRGNGAVPETLNRYGYCWGNPVVIEPIEPTPTPIPSPTAMPSQTPFIEMDLELTEEEKIFVATICGEAIGEGELGWKVVANVIMNRIESKHWGEDTVIGVIENTGFDAYKYKSNQYLKAIDYLDNRTFDYEIYEKVIDAVIPIYRGEGNDITSGATMYFSPKSMSKEKPIPDWDFEKLKELFIGGLDPNSYRIFIYKDECVE